MNKFIATAAAACLALSGAAHAATVSFENVTGQNYQTVFDGFLTGAPRTTEEFAGEATAGGSNVTVNSSAEARTAGNTITTSVGVFTGLGGVGSGTSVTGDDELIQIRSGDNAGRFNVLNPGGNFLDSNDTSGFSWTIDNAAGNIRGVSAFITDPNDAAKELTVSLMDQLDQTVFTKTIVGNLSNSSVWFLTADFTGISWTTAVFDFAKNGTNDGFAISNATLSAVPLPAGGLLLLTGFGALALRRRRKAA